MLPSRLFLTFHKLRAATAEPDGEVGAYEVTPDLLERTLAAAADVERETGIDIRFTFDDGNSSDYTAACPLLKAYERKASFFICGDRIGRPGYLDAGQIREMAAAGMVIGCHGSAHVNWCTLDDDGLARQLRDGRKAVQLASGQAVDKAAAPFGAIDRRVVRAAEAAGFRCLFASSGGFATSDTGLIPRNTIKQGFVPERDLAEMAAGSHRVWAGIYDTARRLKYRFS